LNQEQVRSTPINPLFGSGWQLPASRLFLSALRQILLKHAVNIMLEEHVWVCCAYKMYLKSLNTIKSQVDLLLLTFESLPYWTLQPTLN
jgi:hypothetical protein